MERTESRSFPYSSASNPPNPSPASLSYQAPNTHQSSPSASLLISGTSSATASWESLRKQARLLENDVDSKLAKFSRAGLATRGGGGGVGVGGSRSEYDGVGVGGVGKRAGGSTDGTEVELEELLKKLTRLVNEMAAYLDKPNSQTNPSMTHMLQRHRDILFDYTKEFKKAKSVIQSSREHAELLDSVREDISSYRTGSSRAQDMLLTERGRIDNSNRIADSVLQQAYETKDSLNKQRGILFGANRRIAAVTNQIPGLNSVIGRIKSRKRRDSIILAALIAFCIILLLMYKF